MPRYAKDTTVSVEKSKVEIERTLERYGASEFAYGVKLGMAQVAFAMHGRRIRFSLPLPAMNEERFRVTPGRGIARTAESARKEWEQECRARWRALALAIKAKLEAVESGIASFDEEFMGYLVLPSGETFAEWAAPQLDRPGDRMPPLLPN